MRRGMALGALVIACGSAVQGGNWPGWRGAASDGVAEGAKYPTNWSATENVRWKLDLPGRGSSTPAVWDERIVLTCAVEGKNGVLCLDREGQEKWRTTLGTEIPGKNGKATGCNPSPVTDGRHWYVYFKSGDLACLNPDGTIAWQHNLQDDYGEDTLWWDLGTSPVLTRDNVVVSVMHSGPSFVVAYDKESGELAWKQDRNLGAPSEAAQSYTTPVVVNENGRETIVVLGADHVTAHNAADGKELWRVGGLNPKKEMYFRSISSPVVAEGIAVAPYARGSTLTAIRLGGSGDVTNSQIAWAKTGLGADVPTPAVAAGKLYLCTDRGGVVCLDVKSGEQLWKGELARSRQNYSASPVLAGGRLYLTREDGTTFVCDVQNGLKVVGENGLGDELVVATPVFVDGRILIRTLERLYCIGP